MKHLLETMYILTPESYVYHRNETICISIGGEEKAAVPAKDVDSIVFFGKNTLSTSLLWFCGQHQITLSFLDPSGRFYGTANGSQTGSVLLRKRQFDSLRDAAFGVQTVRDILYGKMVNGKNLLMRQARTTKSEETAQRLHQAAGQLAAFSEKLAEAQTIDELRGIEGAAANAYFACFDDMLGEQCPFRFQTRSRRPPRNEVNAVLSFLYTQLAHDVRSAMGSVGLDAAAGYLHTLRPGRSSFALDMMEELRAPLCDRLVLTLFHRGQLSAKDFQEDGEGIFLNDKGRRTVLSAWRERKREEIRHPFLNEKIPVGLIPHTQAMLFARVLRGDLDRYPPFLWR